MWAFKVLPALFGLRSWFGSPLPASNVEVVVVTHLVVEAPLAWPTVTVTETIGIPATAITHAIPTTSSTPFPESSRPRLNPYNYPSPDYTDSRYGAHVGLRLQDRVSAAHWMAEPQHSKFEFVVFIATIFAVAILTWWSTVLFTGKDRAMRNLEQLPRHIDASFRHAGCRIGYICLLLAWVGLLSDYWIGWSSGYVIWPRIISYLLSYPLVLIVHFQLPPAKSILLLCGEFVKTVVNFARQWLATQANNWYEGRTSKRRIDKIFERPISAITIAECLFPDTCDTDPSHSTFFQILKAFSTDILFFGWNLTIVVIKLRIRSWRQIPSHILDVITVTMQVFFGFGQDDFSWAVWLGCYRTGLKGFCVLISVIWGLIKTGLGAIWMALKLGKAILNRFCIYVMANRLPETLTTREIKTFEDNVNNAYCETSTHTWSEVALLWLRYHAALEDIDRLKARIEDILRHYSSINSREIGNKCVGYWRTIIELLHDNNYFRLLLCAMLNAHHNSLYGRMPNDLDAEHPYQPSQLEFRTVPDPQTGLYIGYKEYTLRSVNKHDLGHEFMMQVERFAMKYEKEPFRMSGILSWKNNGPGNVPDNFDPFVKDHNVFSGVIPGLNIPVYKPEHNPYNILAKRVPAIVNPEDFFGPQIEDFAAQGRLAQWGESEAMKPKVAPFDRDELRRFVSGMQFGVEPRRGHKMASLPKMGAYSSDPCPTGEPREMDFPLYKRNFA